MSIAHGFSIVYVHARFHFVDVNFGAENTFGDSKNMFFI